MFGKEKTAAALFSIFNSSFSSVFANASEPILIDSANHFSKEKALYSKQMSDLKSDYEYENEVFESLEFSLLDLEAAINKGPQPNEPQFSLENIKKEEEEEKMLQVNAQVDDDRFDGKSSTSDTIGLEATPTIAAAVEQQFHSEAAVNTPILEAGVKKVAIPKTTAAASKRVKNKRISQIIADTTTTIPETSTVSSTPEDDDDEEEAETSTGLSQSEAVLDDSTNQRIERILGFLRDVEEDDTRKNHTSVATSHQNYPHLHQQQQTNSNNPTPSDLYSTPYSPSSTSKSVRITHIISLALTLSNNLAAVFDGVKAKIMGQQLELEEKTQTLSLLKKEIKKIKDINKEQSIQL